MSRSPRFTVYSVLGDGNVHTVLQTNSPIKAMRKIREEREKYREVHHHMHSVFFTDDPEGGDRETDVDEMAHEMIERRYRLATWAVSLVLVVLLWWLLAIAFAAARTTL